jgi:hypothetical protein
MMRQRSSQARPGTCQAPADLWASWEHGGLLWEHGGNSSASWRKRLLTGLLRNQSHAPPTGQRPSPGRRQGSTLHLCSRHGTPRLLPLRRGQVHLQVSHPSALHALLLQARQPAGPRLCCQEPGSPPGCRVAAVAWVELADGASAAGSPAGGGVRLHLTKHSRSPVRAQHLPQGQRRRRLRHQHHGSGRRLEGGDGRLAAPCKLQQRRPPSRTLLGLLGQVCAAPTRCALFQLLV